MIKEYTGFCPTQGKEYTVEVKYIDASTKKKTKIMKSSSPICSYHSAIDKCPSFGECPIVEAAPAVPE